MKYEVVMGLEVHVEMATDTKLFCSCSAKFGAEQNENVCPACFGIPGMPAVTNKKAVELGITAGLVLNCDIAKKMTFDKKNYFYPDLPTGYQITQLFAPVCTNGRVEVQTDAGTSVITIKQIHIEEDAGKLVHDARSGLSLVDFNRTSVPLIEIVSNPDFRTSDEVIAYLEKLKSLLSFAGVSDCKMQEGSMRCDVNISVREKGCDVLGTRTEIKNMNSLKAIAAAIAYESQRHIDALETGCETLVQETRRWDENAGETFSMREKESAADYRYFPNPELMPVYISDEWVSEIKKSLPETASDKYVRMTEKLALSEYDSRLITNSRNLSRIFDETTVFFSKPKEVVNWILVDLLSIATGDNKGEEDISIDCEKFAMLINMVDSKQINRNTGKKILKEVLFNNADPQKYAQKNNLLMVSDTGEIEKVIKEILKENEKAIAEYRDGSQKVMGFLVGQVMRKSGGKADPQIVNELIKKMLDII